MPEKVPIIELLSEILEKYKIMYDFRHRYTGERVRKPAYLVPLWLYPKGHSTDFLKLVAQVWGKIFKQIYPLELARTKDLIATAASVAKDNIDHVSQATRVLHIKEFESGYTSFSPFLFDFAYEHSWAKWKVNVGEWAEYTPEQLNKSINNLISTAEEVHDELNAFVDQCAEALKLFDTDPNTVIASYVKRELERLIDEYTAPDPKTDVDVPAWLIEYGNLPKDLLRPWGSQYRDNYYGFALYNGQFALKRFVYFSKEQIEELRRTKVLTEEQASVV